MPDDTRQAILDSACTVYIELGLHGLSMRKVAQNVNLSATAIYRHFEDKQALLIAMIDEGFQRFLTYLSEALEATSPQERMNKTGRRYVEFALDNPGFYNLIFVAPQLWPAPDLPDKVRQRSDAAFQFLIDRIRDQNHTADEEARVRARSVWALTHGLVSLHLAGKLGKDREEFMQIFSQAHKHLREGFG